MRKPMTELDEVRVIDVLLVEDDEGDVLMTREAFEYYKIQNRLHVVGDGEQALQFLRRTGLHANAFVSKPVDFEHFIDAIRQIDTFFLTLVKLPASPQAYTGMLTRVRPFTTSTSTRDRSFRGMDVPPLSTR